MGSIWTALQCTWLTKTRGGSMTNSPSWPSKRIDFFRTGISTHNSVGTVTALDKRAVHDPSATATEPVSPGRNRPAQAGFHKNWSAYYRLQNSESTGIKRLQ